MTLNKKKRRAAALIRGETQTNVAEAFDLSLGRIAQICYYYKQFLNAYYGVNLDRISKFKDFDGVYDLLEHETNCYSNPIKSKAQAIANADSMKLKAA